MGILKILRDWYFSVYQNSPKPCVDLNLAFIQATFDACMFLKLQCKSFENCNLESIKHVNYSQCPLMKNTNDCITVAMDCAHCPWPWTWTVCTVLSAHGQHDAEMVICISVVHQLRFRVNSQHETLDFKLDVTAKILQFKQNLSARHSPQSYCHLSSLELKHRPRLRLLHKSQLRLLCESQSFKHDYTYIRCVKCK